MEQITNQQFLPTKSKLDAQDKLYLTSQLTAVIHNPDDLIEVLENDLIIDILVMHPTLDTVYEKHGNAVKVIGRSSEKAQYNTPEYKDVAILVIEEIAEASNMQLSSHFKGAFNKMKNFLKGVTIDNFEHVPIQKDHSMSANDTIGRTNGLFRLEEVDGQLGMVVRAKISEPEAKYKIKNKQFLYVSPSVDEDNVIKEISFVTIPAQSHASSLSKNEPKTFNQKLMTNISLCYGLLDKIESKKTNLEKQLYLSNELNKAVNSGRIMPYEKEIRFKELADLPRESIDIILNVMHSSAPKWERGKINTRNSQYLKSLQIMEAKLPEIKGKDGLVSLNALLSADLKHFNKELSKAEKVNNITHSLGEQVPKTPQEINQIKLSAQQDLVKILQGKTGKELEDAVKSLSNDDKPKDDDDTDKELSAKVKKMAGEWDDMKSCLSELTKQMSSLNENSDEMKKLSQNVHDLYTKMSAQLGMDKNKPEEAK